ncbi:hypothetical protein [Solimonas sp. SE-A11]|uniref:hypothetical protein n=1 Tax=Solimonas sp. SE-A11 TaxID=3054954 RepID=UPI00259CD707|nr:hypothetical protein [Solimonas sp. SE-A11]MDM4768638.1 hypothetical protein [Solimonas sp. SE-A11]
MTDLNKLEDTWSDLLFHVRRSVRYHMRRQAFFERWHRLTGWISVVSGSAAAASLIGDASGNSIALTASLIVAAVQSLDLFYTPSEMARRHSEYRRRFIELESGMVCTPESSDADLRKCKESRLAIEAEEPPLLTTLNLICHNEMLVAMGFDRREPKDKDLFSEIPWLNKRLAQFLDFGEFSAY